MRKLIAGLCLLLSLPAWAIYISDYSPRGTEVDLKVDAVLLTFSESITKLGAGPVTEEHKATLNLGKLNCDLVYQGPDKILCKLKTSLSPNTDYKMTIKAGFKGLVADERVSFDYSVSFKTLPLSVLAYTVDWKTSSPSITMAFNLKIKPTGLSGVIACSNREVPVGFAPMKDKLGEETITVLAKGEIKAEESCVFYFNRPLSFRDFPGATIPGEKMILDQSVAQMGGYGEQETFEAGARCSSQYEAFTSLLSKNLPFLRCEVHDSVSLELPLTSVDKTKIKNFVKVIPPENVEVVLENDRIVIKNFNTPNRNYVVKVSKELIRPASLHSYTKNMAFQIEIVHNPPLLAPVKAVGVIEKEGPWNMGYSALNIKKLDVSYKFIDSVEDLIKLTDLSNPKVKLEDEKILTLAPKENVNELVPLDVKAWAREKDFKAGVFVGTMKTREVEEKFAYAESALIKDEYQLKERRGFNFGYLFTDIGLHVKKGMKGVLVWATSLKTGKPLPNVSIKVFMSLARMGEKTTDKHGLAFFPDILEVQEKMMSVVATKGDDISYINDQNGMWDTGISYYSFNFDYYPETGRQLVADIVAERPLYLPKEKVHLKIFVRKKIPGSIELAESGKKLTATIIDSRESSVLTKTIELNSYGTAVLEYELPPSAATGRYTVKLSDKEDHYQLEAVFQVAEFRKPEFKVVMDETQTAYNGKITYFKGGPVKDAAGEVVVMFWKSSYRPLDENFNRFAFPGGSSTWGEESTDSSDLSVLSREEMKSDDKGQFSFPKSKVHKGSEYGTLTIEASFPDENGGRIAGRVDSKLNPFTYIPGIDLSQWMYRTGEKIGTQIVAIGSDDKHHVGVPMELVLTKIEYIYERRLGSGNYFYYDSRRQEKEMGKCAFKTAVDFKSCDLVAKEAGYYEIKTKVTDKKAQTQEVKSYTYVYGDGEFLGFEANNHDRMDVSADSSKLKLGDTLKVMAISPLQDGEALITFEREGILHMEQVPFKGNVVLYEKVLTEEKFIPGFYVSIVVVKGRTSDKIENKIDLGKPAFKIGYKRIEVANFEKRLTASVTPGSKQVEPGQMMEATVKLKDHKGKAIQGELAIAVVDDALLTVAGAYKGNYDVLDTFYALGGHGVSNYQTLTQLIGRRTFGKKGANAGGGGGLEARKDFKNTAYWNPQVETDKSGEYKFTFKVPDNLTTWKIIAVAVDKNQQFGVGENEFLVSKSLMIEPALPNFLTQGDKFNAKVVVTNRTGADQEVSVEASSAKLRITDKAKKLSVKNDNKGSLLFPMSIGGVGPADVTFKASTPKARDAFKIDLPVNSSNLKNTLAFYGIVKDKKDVPLQVDPEALKDTLKLSVRTSTTAIDGLDEVFSYVLHYPYGCWEQRLSSAYFLVQYEAFKDVLTFRFDDKKKSISLTVQDLLNSAGDYQTASGGLRYYPGGHDDPDIYLSVFTASSFVTLKKLGYKIDPEVELKLKNFLKGLLANEVNWKIWYFKEAKFATKAMILNVLKDMGEKDLSNHMSGVYANRSMLDLFGLAQLGAFLHSQKGYEKEAKAIFDRIDSLKVTTGGYTSYREPFAHPLDQFKFWNYTDVKSNCAVLQSLTGHTNDKASLVGIVRGVLSKLKNGHWYNTEENRYCFEALRQYAEKFEKKGMSSEFKLALDGKEVKAKPRTVKFSTSYDIVSPEMSSSSKNLTLTPLDKAELYYTTIMSYETPFKPRAKSNAGFGLTKSIHRFNPSKKNWELMKDPTVTIKRSDILRISLDITTVDERHQVMLNDRLAAGLEPINTQLATASLASGALLSNTGPKYEWESPYYRGNGFEYMDLRLDAAQFYSRELKKGTSHVEYLVQAIATGEFLMPETTIEEMYYPDVRGTEVSRKIIVHE